MYKDHKEGKKSRPVVTGCNSNSRGFSNSVSDLLESVNKANQDPYEALNTEDMLAKVEEYNKKAEKIIKEGQEHLLRKIGCKNSEGGMEAIAKCDKLWNKKSAEARRAANHEEDMEPEAGEPGQGVHQAGDPGQGEHQAGEPGQGEHQAGEPGQ